MAAHLLSYLLLALCTLSVSADVSVSIDCGSSDSYKDDNLIVWTGDDGYVQGGESHSVQSSNSISRVMDTLRVFTTQKKNCYHIDSVRQGRVLVRASFYYGNYDGKSSPPTFDLQFDGNHWATVQTSSTVYVYHEVTYVMKKDSISVCVAQTNPAQFPFISALEVRGLESYMYVNVDDNYPLFLRRRVAFGSNATIRFPDDPYDRLWTPEVISGGMIPVRSSALFSKGLTLADQPPPAVLKNAVTAITPNSTLQLSMGFPLVPAPVYVNGYFSEVAVLGPNQNRYFSIFKNNQSFSQPFSPPYENCTELYTSNLTASVNTTFSLVPTNFTTLPPLINAMEIFVIGDELTNGTNDQDVKGLASLQKAFGVLQGWSGDPCLPAPYTWDWINCSTDPVPRVTALFLGSFGLSGILPDFSTMDALQIIDLHNNSLQGPIPDFLGTLPQLKTLNLANNQFNGSMPASLSNKTGLNIVVTGNPNLCTSCPASPKNSTQSSSGCSKKDSNILAIMFGAIIPSFIMLQYLWETLL
ncbi:putative LRR receptor-like serine/threonine-protein kinase [Sesamum angolense]|uniref:LRR receptor-like serine/threonine-protein kinase n=1 Tax=Sesamum angolense TaxID=2727404 RepID=A0AAE2C4A7_9LAMI|nr:putative LRR receptor-like serine/threonine-protein kinase [Sesamum angolense]